MAPHPHQRLGAIRRQGAERAVVLIRVDDDLRGTVAVREGREPIVEDRYLEALERDFGGRAARPCRAQRAVVGGRQEGALLPVNRVDDLLTAELVEAALAHPDRDPRPASRRGSGPARPPCACAARRAVRSAPPRQAAARPMLGWGMARLRYSEAGGRPARAAQQEGATDCLDQNQEVVCRAEIRSVRKCLQPWTVQIHATESSRGHRLWSWLESTQPTPPAACRPDGAAFAGPGRCDPSLA